MDTSTDDTRRARASDWLRATPFELVGLAILLTGALAASVALWWSATGRPDQLPSAALQVGGGAQPQEGDHTGDPAGWGEHPADRLGDGPGDGPAGPNGSQPTGDVDGSHVEVDAAADLTVHVTGGVVKPGLVVVPGGARVGDAVVAAGGLTQEAAPELVNLARVLTDGEHVHVPRIGEEPPPQPSPPADGTGDGAGPSDGGGGLVDLNRASAEELQTLPGIGPARAEAIVRHRETNGPFAVPGDLRAVSGIGEAIFQQLADLVTVG